MRPTAQAFSFLLLFLIQTFALNNIHINNYTVLFIYPIAILILPMLLHKTLRLILAFGYGILLDVFSHTGGLHASSLTAMAFFIPFWGKLIYPKSQYSEESNFFVIETDWKKFLFFMLGCLFVHHLVIFSIESTNANELISILIKTISSLFISVLFGIMFRLILFGKKR